MALTFDPPDRRTGGACKPQDGLGLPAGHRRGRRFGLGRGDAERPGARTARCRGPDLGPAERGGGGAHERSPRGGRSRADRRAGAAVACAIDQALWDIASRRERKPLHATLGAARRAEIPLYANINRRTLDRSPSGFAASARHAIAHGFDAIKIAPFDGVRPGSGDAVAAGIARAAAVRAEIGSTRQLFVDCHWRFDADTTKRALDALLELGIAWFECPIAEIPANLGSLRDLRARANAGAAVLAGCETETGLDGFRA